MCPKCDRNYCETCKNTDVYKYYGEIYCDGCLKEYECVNPDLHTCGEFKCIHLGETHNNQRGLCCLTLGLQWCGECISARAIARQEYQDEINTPMTSDELKEARYKLRQTFAESLNNCYDSDDKCFIPKKLKRIISGADRNIYKEENHEKASKVLKRTKLLLECIWKDEEECLIKEL